MLHGLRFKLAAGFGALLALLLTTGVVSLVLLSRNTAILERVLRENFDSVGYGQGMKDALEALEIAFREAPAADSERLARPRADFRRYLELERGNITVPGERELVDSLGTAWGALETGGRDPARATRVRTLAQRVVDLNLGNILSVDGRVRQSHNQARAALIALLAGGVVLAAAWAAWASRWIVQPLGSLTKSVQEVGRGNLDLVVAVTSRDEVGQLAEAFNAMASRLREYRDSDRQRLLRVHRTTQMAVDSLPDAVAVVSPRGEVELANHAARRLFGLSESGGLGSVADGAVERLVRESIRTGSVAEPRSYTDSIQVFDGADERFFLPKALPILDGERQVAGATVVLADITQLRRLEELRSGALAVVGHELRSPLTSLRMSAHLLLDSRLGDLSEKQTDLVGTVVEECSRLQRIVDELLDAARFDAGRASLELVSRDAEELARHAVSEWEGAFREKGVSLQVECDPALPRLEIDPVRMGHLLENLLSNALRHTPTGGHVSLRVRVDSDAAIFSVSDDGEGISADHLPRVFDRFHRVPGQSADTGVGLGLSIAREIATAHGGTLSVDSEPGRGARFTLRLPLVGCAAPREVS